MTLRVSTAGTIATVTIDNPAKRNAMSAQMWRSRTVIVQNLQNHSMELMRESGEAAEGADAFLHRRPPSFRWTG